MAHQARLHDIDVALGYAMKQHQRVMDRNLHRPSDLKGLEQRDPTDITRIHIRGNPQTE